MKALVLGEGRSGKAAAQELKRRGFEVEFSSRYDLVVTSPGMPVKSELQLGCEELKRRGWKLIAITGSKGKSSLVKLIADILGGIPCGNYGRPVTDLIGEKPGWAVVEVSSFQLETTTLAPDTFVAAAVLNLQDDHLDRHLSREVYHGLKKKLLTFTSHGLKPHKNQHLCGVCPQRELWAGSYFDNEILRENAKMAVDLLRIVGVPDKKIRQGFKAFKPLAHRFELIAKIKGVKFIDDSKATSIAALIAGVKMAQGPVRLIAGGLPKGDDPKIAIETLTSRVKKVYLIGKCAEAFAAKWQASVKCELSRTMSKAVAQAMREAKRGETVLLSPGTASFDQFKSFEERGEVFASLVKDKDKK